MQPNFSGYENADYNRPNEYSSSMMAGGYEGVDNDGFSATEKEIMNHIRSFDGTANGMNISFLCQKLARTYSEKEVRYFILLSCNIFCSSCVDSLVTDGHVYNTVDDDHIKTTAG